MNLSEFSAKEAELNQLHENVSNLQYKFKILEADKSELVDKLQVCFGIP